MVKRSVLTVFASLCGLMLIIPPQTTFAQERPQEEQIRVEWSPGLALGGYVLVKGNEAMPVHPTSVDDAGPVERLFEDCSTCKDKLRSMRKKQRKGGVLSAVGLAALVAGYVAVSNPELNPLRQESGIFLPIGIMIGGLGAMGAAAQKSMEAQSNLFQAVRLYNGQAP